MSSRPFLLRPSKASVAQLIFKAERENHWMSTKYFSNQRYIRMCREQTTVVSRSDTTWQCSQPNRSIEFFCYFIGEIIRGRDDC
jgi:hypothetical protein